MVPHLHLIITDWIMARYNYKMVVSHNRHHNYYQLNLRQTYRDTLHITDNEIYLFDDKDGNAYLKVNASNPDLFKLMEECIDKYWYRLMKEDNDVHSQ